MLKVLIAIATTAFILSNYPNKVNARSEEFTRTLSVGDNWKVDTTPKPRKQTTTIEGASKIGGESGKITGKVLNAKTGDPIVGASVTLKSGNITRSVKSDYNGIYSVSELPVGTYTLTISHITFGNKQLEDIKIVKKDVTTQDITMEESKGKNLDEVVVTSKGPGRIKESVASLLIQQKNAANVSDGISAEAIRRTPDKNTSDIMKRVSGASIQDDKFVVIRGLNDRYNASFINNCPLPSSESDRKAFSFDVFPSNMLDNLVIVKTATPDMNADFAGGTIYINTKDIPAKSFQSITLGAGYNTISTFKERKYDPGGKLDWLGIDDGARNVPSTIPSTDLKFFSRIEKGEIGKNLKNNWATNTGKTPLNYNFQFVKGINVQRKKRDFLGVLFSATYNRTFNVNEGEKNVYEGNSKDYNSEFKTITYTSQVLTGLMANIALKLNNNNKISFKNLLSVNTDDRIIKREGYSDYDKQILVKPGALWFTSNVTLSSQLNGEHFLPKPKLKLNWTGGFTSVDRQIPCLRKLGTRFDEANDPRIEQTVNLIRGIGNPESSGSMFISSTKENIKNASFDIQRLFRIDNSNSILVKTGAYLQERKRDFSARYLTIVRLNDSSRARFDDSLVYLEDDKVFDSQNFGIQKNGLLGFGLSEDFKSTDKYSASSSLAAYYLMLDARFLKFIRVNGGLRSENFKQNLSSQQRVGQDNTYSTTVTDYLPSANLIVSLNAKQNLRFSYSQTINRPEYRELAPFLFYDYVTQLSIGGSDTLKRVKIDNFDFRYEFYPTGGQLFSVSFFHKKIPNPIELVVNTNRNATYINATDGKIQGVEFEARTNIGSILSLNANNFLSNTTVFGNLALVKSEVSFGSDSVIYGPSRTMQGQSPYIYNVGVTYQDQKGYSGTLQMNYSAPRLYVAGDRDNSSIFENGRKVLDLQLSKTFLKNNIELKLNVKDLLANDFLRFYDVDKDGKYDADIDRKFISNQMGRVISASVTYKF